MGTLAKRLGQLAARGVESDSARILKTGTANKVPGSLAQLLDGTLRQGHDMKVIDVQTENAVLSFPRSRSLAHAIT